MGTINDDWVGKQTARMLQEQMLEVEKAMKHMDPDQLTDGQKFAIAFMAGVPTKSGEVDGDGTLTITLQHRVAVVVEHGRWVVYSSAGLRRTLGS